MEQQHTNDEIDLGLVFNKIGDLWRNFLIWIFNCIQFILRNWIVLLVIIAVGVGLGYVWKQNSKTQMMANIIVQTNIGSANYMYNRLQSIKPIQLSSEGKKYGFDPDNLLVLEIDAEPIIDIISLTETINTDDRSLDEFLAQADFVDELLFSDIFLNEYKYHKLDIILNEGATQETVESIITYLNDNPLLDAAKQIAKEETEQKIRNHRKSIEGIDKLFLSFTETKEGVNPSFVFKNNETINLHKVLEEKKKIMEYIQEERIQLGRLDKAIIPITSTKPFFRKRFFDKKMMIAPIFLVFVFVLLVWMRKMYFRLENMKNEREN